MSVYTNYTTRDSRQLTNAEIDSIKEVFLLFDKNGDDTITNAELGLCMRALGQYPTESELADIIAEIDADGNGVIEFSEFVDLMARMPAGRLGSQEQLRHAFNYTLDHEKDGRVDIEEFRRLLTTLGEPLTDEDLNEMIRFVEIDGDGKVQYESMVRMMVDKPPTPPPFLE